MLDDSRLFHQRASGWKQRENTHFVFFFIYMPGTTVINDCMVLKIFREKEYMLVYQGLQLCEIVWCVGAYPCTYECTCVCMWKLQS